MIVLSSLQRYLEVGIRPHSQTGQMVWLDYRQGVRTTLVQAGRPVSGPLQSPDRRPGLCSTIAVGVGEQLYRFFQASLECNFRPGQLILLLGQTQLRERAV